MSKMLITGGCGFIGSNAAAYFMDRGWEVVILDNFSRPGARSNAAWLRNIGKPTIVEGDLCNRQIVNSLIGEHRDLLVVLHLAAQVAVTKSLVDPISDCEINTLGTLNLLEAVRRQGVNPIFIYSSTNKVYGDLQKQAVQDIGRRYALINAPRGIHEEFPVDFYSPYGCSKGSADMYVLDYARVYGLRTVSLRQSCIYGPRQYGLEDQGWVAWFIICTIVGRPVTIFGDGKQVRDVLYVDDLLDCYGRCIAGIDSICGQVFNVGGGLIYNLSLLEFIDLLKARFNLDVQYSFAAGRPGDQKVYISDVSRLSAILDWKPNTSIEKGIGALIGWISDNKASFSPGERDRV